ncbi:3102_t:CDS:2 [Funneliformis geosporum]|nr:3102_t:CDS:2 [Funneliformis geosporum]
MVKTWKSLETWLQENYCIQFIVRIGNFFPVLFLIVLVGWSYYAFVIRLCIYYLLNSNPEQGIVYLLIYHPLFLLMMWSYFKATFISPGYSTDTGLASADSSITTYIPLDQRRSNSGETTSNNAPESSSSPSNQDQQEVTQQRKKDNTLVMLDESGSPISLGSIMVKQSGEKRFCQKCNFDKPDRAHHCRMYFKDGPPVIELDLNWTFLILLGGVFFLCLIGFTIFHTGLILSNQTTLESLQKHNYKVRENGDVTTSKYLNLFDIGRRNNWIQVMGPKWYFWFIPIGYPFSDGKSWPLNSYRYSTLCESVENLNNPIQIV